jgi:hypothetical protein
LCLSLEPFLPGSGWGELNSVARGATGATSPRVVATYQYKQHGLSRLYDEALYNPVVSKQYTVTGDVSQALGGRHLRRGPHHRQGCPRNLQHIVIRSDQTMHPLTLLASTSLEVSLHPPQTRVTSVPAGVVSADAPPPRLPQPVPLTLRAYSHPLLLAGGTIQSPIK